MKNQLNAIEEVLLMGPGPSCVHESVYDALSKKTLGHLDPSFIKIMDGIKLLMQQVLNTKNPLTIPVSGTGSAGMETCFVNLIEKDDPVLILINGVFGKRMQDVATRLGAKVDTLEFEWGTPVILEDVTKKVKEHSYKIVAVVHAETSTGVRNPVDEIGDILKDSDTLYLVDTVTSLGGIEILVSFSERAIEALRGRKTKVPNWYLDLSMIINYWEGAKRAYHHTAPINMLYALYQALFLVMEEGLENVYKRHYDNHRDLVKGLENLGLSMKVEKEFRLPMLNAVICPQGIDEAAVRTRLRNEFKIEIGGGLGPLEGQIWRIGLMGHTARKENVERFLEALRLVLK